MSVRNYNTLANEELDDQIQDSRPNEIYRERPAPTILTSFPKQLCIMGVVVSVIIFISVIVALAILDNGGDSHPNVDRASYFTEVEVKSVLSDFQSIANANNGSRSVQTGYNASAAYIAASLSSSGWDIEIQSFTVNTWEVIGSPFFADLSKNLVFVQGQGYEVLTYCGSGSIVLPVAEVGAYGCSSEDYASITVPSIGLVRDGSCTPSQKASLAIKAGFPALIIWKDQTAVTLAIDSLDSPISIPVIVVSYQIGSYVSYYSLSGDSPSRFDIGVSTIVTPTTTSNVIAKWPEGSSSAQIVAGAQLDSPPNSAGINNNGVGAAILFQYALTFEEMDLSVENQPILCWWSAGELGNSGSQAYVNSRVQNGTIQKVAMYINFDVVGSPNPLIQVYNTSVLPSGIQTASSVIAKQMTAEIPASFKQFSALEWQKEWTSDWNAFANASVPVGGYFTGANAIMTGQQKKAISGGIVNTAFDPCFQQKCDNFGNFATSAISQLSASIVDTLNFFVEKKNLADYLSP